MENNNQKNEELMLAMAKELEQKSVVFSAVYL